VSEASKIRHAGLTGALEDFWPRVGFGDAMILLYLVAFVRQWFWLLPDGPVTWALTLGFSLTGWIALVRAKEPTRERLPTLFLPLVALPLLFLYGLRVAIPDTSYDTLHYHLLLGERGLKGIPYDRAEFFPVWHVGSSAPDMVTALARKVVGYRLGTAVNYAAWIWTAISVYRLIGPLVVTVWLRCLATLAVMLAEQTLFQSSIYMTDVMALPLLTEATLLIFGSAPQRLGGWVRFGALLGMSAGIKFSNLIFAAPLYLCFLFQAFRHLGWSRAIAFSLAAGAALTAPLVPVCVFNFWQSGNPLFPFYNALFPSPYRLPINFTDALYGGQTFGQKLLWPISCFFNPERLSELKVCSGRLSLGFATALSLLPFAWREIRGRMLCLLMVISSLIWSFCLFGYARYVPYLEILGGLILVAALQRFSTSPGGFRAIGAAIVLSALFAGQMATAVWQSIQRDWSGRPSIFQEPARHREEAALFFRDQDFRSFVSPELRNQAAPVEAWIATDILSTGTQILLRDVPISSIHFQWYSETAAARERLTESLRGLAGRRVYSLCYRHNLSQTLQLLEAQHLTATEAHPILVPFYSAVSDFPMVLLKVQPAPDNTPKESPYRITSNAAPLPAEAYHAELSVPVTHLKMKPRETRVIWVGVKNRSALPWPANGGDGGIGQVWLGGRWLDQPGRKMPPAWIRAALAHDLAPGSTTMLPIRIRGPRKTGQYALELDMVQEQVTWFAEKGSAPLRLVVEVRD